MKNLVITGASGKLGAYLLEAAQTRFFRPVAWSRTPPRVDHGMPTRQFDLTDRSELLSQLDWDQPDVIIHTAALSAVDQCYQNPALADLVNRQVAEWLAQWCEKRGSRLIYVSTDMVFDGERAPYAESDPPAPLSQYGASKRRGEQSSLEYSGTLVVRLPLMVGPALGRGLSYYDHLLDSLSQDREVSLFTDEWRSMLTFAEAADALLQLARLGTTGMLHLPGTRTSRYELGLLMAEALGKPADLVKPSLRAHHVAPEPRGKDLTMRSERLSELLPDWAPAPLADQIPAMISA